MSRLSCLIHVSDHNRCLRKKYIHNLNDSIFHFVSTMGEEEDFLCKTSSVQQTCMLFCLPSVFVNTLLNLSSYSYGLIPYLDLKQIPHAPLFALIAKANFPLSTQVQQKLLRVCCRPSKPVFWVWGTLALFIWQLNEEEPRCSCLCLSAELARAEDNRYADAALWARHSLWPRLQHRADEVRKVAKKNTYAVLLLTWEGSLLKIKISKIH